MGKSNLTVINSLESRCHAPNEAIGKARLVRGNHDNHNHRSTLSSVTLSSQWKNLYLPPQERVGGWGKSAKANHKCK